MLSSSSIAAGWSKPRPGTPNHHGSFPTVMASRRLASHSIRSRDLATGLMSERWEWRRSRKLVFSNCARSAPGLQGQPNRPSSIISLVVGRRRRPVDGLLRSEVGRASAKAGSPQRMISGDPADSPGARGWVSHRRLPGWRAVPGAGRTVPRVSGSAGRAARRWRLHPDRPTRSARSSPSCSATLWASRHVLTRPTPRTSGPCCAPTMSGCVGRSNGLGAPSTSSSAMRSWRSSVHQLRTRTTPSGPSAARHACSRPSSS